MASKLPIHLLPHFIILFFLPSFPPTKAGNINGFSVELIHRDSPLSPFHNPSLTSLDRLTESAAAHHSLSLDSTRSTVYPSGASHLMKFSIGTPPVQVLGVMDTGSDLVWYRCKPCADCENRQVSVFDPHGSSTYRDLSCGSSQCKEVNQSRCSEGPCDYMYGYGDGSFTKGVLATETLTFDSTDGGTVSFPGFGFGCGHNNSVSFDSRLAGLVGLGGRPLSLVSQLGPSIDWKFSYCLMPFEENTSTSFMNFGDNAVISGSNVVSTPLVRKEDYTYYYITLEGISIGDKKIEVASAKASDGSANGTGNIFIDCGTTLTLIDRDVFNQLSKVLTDAVKLPATTDPGKTFLCYRATSRDEFPTKTFHFAGGADLVLHPVNTMTVPSPDGLVCLAMLPTDGTAVFGDLVQQNFHVAYDLKGNMVSFEPTDCSKLSS